MNKYEEKLRKLCNKYNVKYIGIQYYGENKTNPIFIFFNIASRSTRTVDYSKDIKEVEVNLKKKLELIKEG